jgi:hypothetical protein
MLSHFADNAVGKCCQWGIVSIKFENIASQIVGPYKIRYLSTSTWIFIVFRAGFICRKNSPINNLNGGIIRYKRSENSNRNSIHYTFLRFLPSSFYIVFEGRKPKIYTFDIYLK